MLLAFTILFPKNKTFRVSGNITRLVVKVILFVGNHGLTGMMGLTPLAKGSGKPRFTPFQRKLNRCDPMAMEAFVSKAPKVIQPSNRMVNQRVILYIQPTHNVAKVNEIGKTVKTALQLGTNLVSFPPVVGS